MTSVSVIVHPMMATGGDATYVHTVRFWMPGMVAAYTVCQIVCVM